MNRISQDLQDFSSGIIHLRSSASICGFFSLLLFFVSLCLCGENAAFAQRVKVSPRRVVSPWDVEAREYYGTPQSEKAVEKGLAYLASRQEAGGFWRSGGYQQDVGINGLCLMAFLASGHQPGRGRYGLVMNEAVDFLANSVSRGGQYNAAGLVRSTSGGPPMYGHGFATLALSEVYGMTRRRDLKPKIQAAIKLIEDTQNQNGNPILDGGWRYQPMQGDADISVTVVQVLALRGARNAGLKVSQETIDRAIKYMKRCQNRSDGGFNYQVGQQPSGPARTGAGLLSLCLAGEKEGTNARSALDYLIKHPLNSTNEWSYREHYYYTLYYVTQAAYQIGGDFWKKWYTNIRDRLVNSQSDDGSWSANGYSEAGPEYATAMAINVLQVPAGLLPIYQK